MNRRMRRLAASLMAVTLIASGGCGVRETGPEADAKPTRGGWSLFSPRITVPAGTAIEVRLTSEVSSETARAGDPWSGVVVGDVTVGERVAIPAGSAVRGVVARARPARRGTRAELELAVRSVTTGAEAHDVRASAAPVVAGSTRARNLGAIAGGAAAGALIGKAVGGRGRDAAVGGLVGGAAATGAVAASKGYQVILRAGTRIGFTVDQRAVVG